MVPLMGLNEYTHTFALNRLSLDYLQAAITPPPLPSIALRKSAHSLKTPLEWLPC